MIDRKEYWVCLVCSLMLIQPVLAQDSLNLEKYYPKPLISALGIFGGVNFSTVRGASSTIGGGSNDVYYSTTITGKIGYSLGAELVHRFNNHLELHARFLWETKGVNQEEDSILLDLAGVLLGTATISSQSTTSKYAIVSISPQLLLGRQSQVNIGLGGYFGILHDSKTTIEYYHPIQYSLIQNGYFKKYDYGLQFNVGYKFNYIKSTQFTIQFIYSYGIQQISEFHDLYSWSPPLHNNSCSIVLGVRLVNIKNLLNKPN